MCIINYIFTISNCKMDTNEYNNLLKYIDKNPELSKLIMCKTKPINFIKYNNAINFYNVDGSLNINAQYIIKHNDSIMGLITIIDIKTQNTKSKQIEIEFVAYKDITDITDITDIARINSIKNNNSITKVKIILNKYPNIQLIKLNNINKYKYMSMVNNNTIINDIKAIKKTLNNLFISIPYCISNEDYNDIIFLMNTYVLPIYKNQMKFIFTVFMANNCARTPTNEVYVNTYLSFETHISYIDDIDEIINNIMIDDIPCEFLPFSTYDTRDQDQPQNQIQNQTQKLYMIQRIISIYNDIKAKNLKMLKS